MFSTKFIAKKSINRDKGIQEVKSLFVLKSKRTLIHELSLGNALKDEILVENEDILVTVFDNLWLFGFFIVSEYQMRNKRSVE